jgi:hypothetical protein
MSRIFYDTSANMWKVADALLNDIKNLPETSDTRPSPKDDTPVTAFDGTTAIKILVTINNVTLCTELSIGTVQDMLVMDSTIDLEKMFGKCVLEHINALTKRH